MSGKTKSKGRVIYHGYASPDHPIYKQGSRVIISPGFGKPLSDQSKKLKEKKQDDK